MKTVAWALVMVLAPIAATADPKDERAEKGDQNRVVCRTENVTGSRLGARKRCLTAAEWGAIAQADRQSVERIQQQRYYGNESGSGAIQGDFGRNN